jgi:hypothetical protein
MDKIRTKDEILIALRKLETLHAPKKIGQGQFEKLSGVKRYQWQQATGFARWSDVRSAAGLTSLEWGSYRDKEVALGIICSEIARAGKFLTKDELRLLRKNQPEIPSPTTLTEWFVSKRGLIEALIEFAQGSNPPDGVMDLLRLELALTPESIQNDNTTIKEPESSSVSESFIPPVIQCLPDLAFGEPTTLELLQAAGKDSEREMERRVGICLQLLGLEVDTKARPGKEEADGIAIGRSPLEAWGLIYDAKTKERSANYRISVDERRKFESYARLHSPELTRQGCRRVHLVVVAGSFHEKDIQVAQEIRLSSGQAIQSVCLVTAAGLVALVDQKLRGLLTSDQLERVFATVPVVK